MTNTIRAAIIEQFITQKGMTVKRLSYIYAVSMDVIDEVISLYFEKPETDITIMSKGYSHIRVNQYIRDNWGKMPVEQMALNLGDDVGLLTRYANYLGFK